MSGVGYKRTFLGVGQHFRLPPISDIAESGERFATKFPIVATLIHLILPGATAPPTTTAPPPHDPGIKFPVLRKPTAPGGSARLAAGVTRGTARWPRRRNMQTAPIGKTCADRPARLILPNSCYAPRLSAMFLDAGPEPILVPSGKPRHKLKEF